MKKQMSAREFVATLEELGLDWRTAPAALGLSRRTIFHYSSGATPIPGPVARLMRLWLEIKRKEGKGLKLPFDDTEDTQ